MKNFIDKYINRLNLSILCIVIMAGMLFIGIKTVSLGNTLIQAEQSNMDELQMLMALSSSIKTVYYLFFFVGIASVIEVIGNAIQYAYKGVKNIRYLIYLISGAATVYSALKIVSFAAEIKNLAGQGLGSITNLLGLVSDGASLIVPAISIIGVLTYILIGGIAAGVFACVDVYQLRKNGGAADESFSTITGNIEGTDSSSQYEADLQKMKEVSGAAAQKAKEASAAATKRVKQLTKKQKAAIIGAVAVIIVGFAGFKIYDTFFNFDQINLMEGMETPTFSGYDGEGIVETYPQSGNFDYDKTKIGIEEFIDDVTYSIDKTEGLSNGDEVTITAEYSEQTAKALKIKVTEDVLKVKVEGLVERYKDEAEISREDLKLIYTAMDADAETFVNDYFQSEEQVDWERLAVIFARAQEKSYDTYDDKLFGIYRVNHGEKISYFRVDVTEEMNKSIKSTDLHYEEGRVYDYLKDAIGIYADDDCGYDTMEIGISDVEPKTLKEFLNASIILRAEIEAIQSDTVKITVKDNTLIYSGTINYIIDSSTIDEIKTKLKDELDEIKDTYVEIASALEKESGIKGVSVKVEYFDKKNNMIYSRTFTSEN